MTDFMTVSEAARELEAKMRLSVPPRAISDLFYQRRLPDKLAPIIGGRRLISRSALPQIAKLLRQKQDNKTTPTRSSK